MRRHHEGVDRRALVAVDRRRVHPQRVQRQHPAARTACRAGRGDHRDVEVCAPSPGVISTCTPRRRRRVQDAAGRRDRRAAGARRPSPAGTGGPDHRSAMPSSRPRPLARWPASPPRRARATTPGAPGRHRGRRRRRRWWRGLCRSLRVAVSATAGGSARCADSVSMSEGHNPSRVPICVASSAPMTLWSPPRPLPMSWHSAPSTSRSGRATRVVNALAARRSRPDDGRRSRCGRRRAAAGRAPRPIPETACPTSRFGPALRSWPPRRGPAASITSRSLSAWRGHGVRSSGAERGQPAQRRPRHRQPGGRRCRRHPQDQPGITCRAGIPGQDDLAVELHHALVERPAHRSAQRGETPARQRIARGAQSGVDVVADGAGRVGQDPGQVEPVPDPQRRPDLVGVLGHHLVAAPARDPVQFGAHVRAAPDARRRAIRSATPATGLG